MKPSLGFQPYYVPFQTLNNTQKVQAAIEYLKSRGKYALGDSCFRYVPASKQSELGIVYRRESCAS